MTDPCDPSLVPLRCWEHEDCLEHPELALACGPRACPQSPVGDERPWMGCGFPDGWGEQDETFGDGRGYGSNSGGGTGTPLEYEIPLEMAVADWSDRGRRAGWDDWVQNFCEADVARCAEGR